MSLPVRLVIAATGSAGLYTLARMLYDYGSLFTELYYDAPLTVIVVVAVVLFLALGILDAARDWNSGWRRIASMVAAALALVSLTLPNWSGGFPIGDAVWYTTTILALPAAVLTVWSWFRWGPAEGEGIKLDATADMLARYRIPVALVFGFVAPCVLITIDSPGQWADPMSAFLTVALAVAAAFTLFVLPSALTFLSGITSRRRRALLLGIGVLSAALAVYISYGVEVWSNADTGDYVFSGWLSVMAPALLVVLVYLASRASGWAGEGFTASSAASLEMPAVDQSLDAKPGGAIARRRSTRARRA